MMILLSIFEVIGTIAFAMSGALIGIEKKLDLFGVIFLSITTAVGGGIFRDIIIGNTPPTAFVEPSACLISITTALITFYTYEKIHKLKNIIIISDAIGLAVFTGVGSAAAISRGMNEIFIVVTMGLITGIGGGILRDVFVKDIPFVFRKEIYAVASMLGAACFYLTYNIFSYEISLYICFSVTFAIRIFSIIYDLHLPVPKNKINIQS
jgi:uncharacterized membrane protein YeiH